jgi:hypothetical protein
VARRGAQRSGQVGHHCCDRGGDLYDGRASKKSEGRDTSRKRNRLRCKVSIDHYKVVDIQANCKLVDRRRLVVIIIYLIHLINRRIDSATYRHNQPTSTESIWEILAHVKLGHACVVLGEVAD